MVSGTRLGPYEILTRIGEGGMGSVYKARDTRVDRTVAVKYIDAAFADRFERETRAGAALNHPHICQLYDVGPNYLVMEYVDGAPLHAPMPLREALKCADQILDALHAAHTAGIIHRDLKPANILLTRSGVKVLDFGLALQATAAAGLAAGGDITRTIAITGPNVVLGTPNYMSPEQIRAQEVDARSDIFAFGIVLYELLSGRRAYDGDSAVDVMSSVLKEPLPELPSDVPAPIRQIVADCTAKDRDERYASANDVRLALRAVAMPSAPSLVLIDAAPATQVRSRGLAAALAVGCAGLTVLSAYLYFRTPVRVKTSDQKLTPVAADRSQQVWPAWSPDGKSIAYIAGGDAKPQLMVRTLNSPTPVRVVDLPGGPIGGVAWFPAADRLLFIADRYVYAVRLAGGAPDRLLPDRVVSASLSGDGKILAVWAMGEHQGAIKATLWYSSPPGAPLRVWPGAPTQDLARLTTLVRFAQTGSKVGLVLQQTGGKVQFWTMQSPSDAAPAVLRFESHDFGATVPQFDWFPDGRHVVITDVPNGRVLFGDIDSGWIEPFLTTVAGRLLRPMVSPDGKKILITTRMLDMNLHELPFDGSQPRPVRTTVRNESSLSASKAGDLVAYITDHSGSEAVWARSLSGEWERPIVTQSDFMDDAGESRLVGAVLSPDGSKVAYIRSAPGKGSRMYLSPASGGRPVELSYRAVGGAPAWSPDSRRLVILAVRDGRLRIAVVEPGTDQEPKLLPGTCSTVPAWSPDGRWIACGDSTTRSLFLVSPDGALQKPVGSLPDFDSMRSGIAWAADSMHVLVASSAGGSSRLSSIDIRSGRSRLIADYGESFSFSANRTYSLFGSLMSGGNSLGITTMTDRSEISMVERFPDPRTLH